MKKLVFICGPNGVGKSTVGLLLNSKLSHSALVDSDWCRCIYPFEFTPELIDLNKKNIVSLLTNYLASEYIEYVIFTYSLHGPRKDIFDYVIDELSCFEYKFKPITLLCEVDENIRRMEKDNREKERIERAISTSRMAYLNLNFPEIDTTNINASEVANKILEIMELRD